MLREKIGWRLVLMCEFIVIVESIADAQLATKLAERVITEKIDWLEQSLLRDLFCWRGLDEGSDYSCWKDIKDIRQRAKDSGLSIPKFLGHGKSGVLKADGAAAKKVLDLVRLLQHKSDRKIIAVVFIRDLDNQPQRRKGIEQARSEHIDQQPQLEIIVGTADKMREAWVLNGFLPLSDDENRALDELRNQLCFDPCKESHRLRSSSSTEPDRIRNPKIVLGILTDKNKSREQQCWEDTELELLRRRGVDTGLKEYLLEIEERLVPTLLSPAE